MLLRTAFLKRSGRFFATVPASRAGTSGHETPHAKSPFENPPRIRPRLARFCIGAEGFCADSDDNDMQHTTINQTENAT